MSTASPLTKPGALTESPLAFGFSWKPTSQLGAQCRPAAVGRTPPGKSFSQCLPCGCRWRPTQLQMPA